jgi:hypothetical protein
MNVTENCLSAAQSAIAAYFTAVLSRTRRQLRCESPDHTRARQCLRGEAPVISFNCVGRGRRLELRHGLDGDVHAEPFELSHESSGLLLGGSAAVVPVRSQIVVGNFVANDVVVGDEDVVAGGADCFLGAASAADLGVVRSEVGALAAGGDVRRLGERDPQPHRAVPGASGTVFPTGGVVARADPGLGRQVPGGREDGHVQAHLGDQDFGDPPSHARDGHHQLDDVGDRAQ